MKRIDQYKAKLKAAEATLKIRRREFNIVSRELIKTIDSIDILNRKIKDANDKKLAAITSNAKSND
jgi:exosome complex RNA-binding protein Rrp4